MSLVGFEIKVDHVAGFARSLRTGVHGDADIGLRERRRVIGAVTAHGDELAFGLLVADEPQFVLGRCLGEEVVDAGFRRNGGGSHRIIAGDHDRADAHAAQFREALADAAFDDVLKLNDAKQSIVLGHRQRGAARFRDRVGNRIDFAHGFGADTRPQDLHSAAGTG